MRSDVQVSPPGELEGGTGELEGGNTKSQVLMIIPPESGKVGDQVWYAPPIPTYQRILHKMRSQCLLI